MLRRSSALAAAECGGGSRARRLGRRGRQARERRREEAAGRSTTSSSSTRRTTASTTCTAAGRAFAASPTPMPAHTTQLGQTGPSTFAPYQCLYQDDANLQAQSAANPSGPLSDDLQQHDRRHVPEPLHERAVLDRRLPQRRATSRARRSLIGVQLPERAAQAGHQPRDRSGRARRPPRRLHARHRAPLLRGAVPAQRRPAEPLRAPERRRRARDGHLRHRPSCPSTSTCTSRATRSTRSWTTSSRPRSAART